MPNVTFHRRDAYLKLADGDRLRILDGPTVESETEVVRSSTATKPDTQWTATDSHGHEHRYVRDAEDVPRLPSLDRRGRHVECDGACGDMGCDGYTITEWFCRECGDQAEPGFAPDYAAMTSGIPVSVTATYSLTVEGDVLHRDLITGAAYSYIDEDGVEHQYALPPLYPVGGRSEFGFRSMQTSTDLTGSQMKAVKHKPTGP